MVCLSNSRRSCDLTSAAARWAATCPAQASNGAAEDGETKDDQRTPHVNEPRSILEGQYD